MRANSRLMNFIPPTERQVKTLIWIYFWLIIFEGSLRKWVVPSLSDPLLVIRDPVVLLIYLQAIRGNFFPQHWLVKVTVWLGVLTFFWGCIHVFASGSYLTMVVTLYGVRTYFLHLPLIFIIGHVFKREDVLKLGKWCLLLSVPMVLLMVAQYSGAADSWLNKGTLSEDGGQMMAAMGKVRPAGTFSFNTGPTSFYPLVIAFIMYGLMNPRVYGKWLLLAAAGAVAIDLPLSGSRTMVVSASLVVMLALSAGVFLPRLLPRILLSLAIITALGVAVLSLPVGREAVESFVARWDSATEQEGHGKGGAAAVANRMSGNFLDIFTYLDQIPLAGYGIGAGTNVGVKLQTGATGFLYGEFEWTRNVMEAGPILGFTYIGFRMTFAFYLLSLAWRKLKKGDPLPWLFMSSVFIALSIGQTGQPTTLGFMAFIAGISLSSVGGMRGGPTISENRLRWLRQRKRVREAAGEVG